MSCDEEEKGPGEKGDAAVDEEVQVVSKSLVRKRNRKDRAKCEEESNIVRRRITRSFAARQRAEAEAAGCLKEAGRNVSYIEGVEYELIEADEMGVAGSDIAERKVEDDSQQEKFVDITCEEIKFDEERSTGSDGAGKQEEVGAGDERVTEKGEALLDAGQNGNSPNICNGDGMEEHFTCAEEDNPEMEMTLLPDSAEREKEADSDQKEGTEDERVTEKGEALLDTGQNGNSPNICNGDGMEEHVTCAEEDKPEMEMTLLPDSAECEKEADSDQKEGMEELVSGTEQKQNGSAIAKRKTRKRRTWLEVKVRNRRFLRSDVAKQREEADSCEREFFEEAAVRGDQYGDCLTITDRDGVELVQCEEEINVGKERTPNSDLGKQREESYSDKMIVAKVGAGRKRNREESHAKVTGKKIGTAMKYGQNQTEKTGRKKRKMDSVKYGVERTGVKTDRVTEPVVPATGQRDCSVEKRKQSNLQKMIRMKAVNVTKNSSVSIGDKRKMFSIVGYKNIRVPGKGGISRVLPNNKKLGALERAHVRMERKQTKKTSEPSTAAKHSTLKRALLSAKQIVPKISSSISLGKNQVTRAATSAGRKNSFMPKKEPESLSTQIKTENTNLSNRKAQVMAKGERSCASKLPITSKVKLEAANTDHRTAKEKLRDQIKSMLLNSGWKIDLRPRRGKNYADSVYISPQGSGYWSITKAYDVFKCQLSCVQDIRGKKLSKKSPQTSNGRHGNLDGTISFSPIPMEALNMLKKKIVNKRRSKKELEEAKRKLKGVRKKLKGGDRGRNAKGAVNVKCSNDKNFKNKERDTNTVIKDNSSVDASTKGGVGPSAQKSHLLSGRNRNKRRGCTLLVRGTNQVAETETNGYVPYLWKRTIISWLIDLGVVSANVKAKYMNKRRTRAMLEGIITRDGILCSCCNEIHTVSSFESHAGSKLCQPYQNIYVEGGISLYRCQLNAWEKQEESKRSGFFSIDVDGDDPNDDTCGICGDGGDLICCDACPSTFHLSCLDIQMLPPGDWYCTYCSCRFCGMVSDAAAQECGQSVPQLYSCSQCEGKCHQKCVPEPDAIFTNSGSPRISFCGQSCRKIFERLHSLLGVKNDMEEGFSWSVVHRIDEDSPESLCGLDQRVECNSKIAVALGALDECFLPIMDQRSGINLIHNVVYNCGSNFNRLDYRGFYTFVLERDDEVISAACLRIHGTRLAEMPFIGTRSLYRRQGMCRRLLDGIESALCSLNIEKLIIPAISELMDTWTAVFGFKPLDISQKQEISSMNVLVFPGTDLLIKPLQRENSTELCETASGVGVAEQESESHHTPEVSNGSPSLFSVGPNLHISDEIIVQPHHEVEEVEPGSPCFGGSIRSSAEVFSESLAVPLGSECQAPDSKCLKTTDMELLHLEDVHRDVSVVRNMLQVDSFIEHEIKLPSDSSVQDGQEPKDEYASVGKNLPTFVGTLVHTFHVKSTLSSMVSAVLQDSGANSAPAANGTSSSQTLKAHCGPPYANSCTEQNSSGHSSDVTIQSKVPKPLQDGFQASTKHIVNGNCNLENQATSCKDSGPFPI